LLFAGSAAPPQQPALVFKKLQLIFGRNIVGHVECSDAIKARRKLLGFDVDVDVSTDSSDAMKHCRAAVGLIARVPPGQRVCVDSAADWILSRPHSGDFLQACGLSLISQDFVNHHGKPLGSVDKPEFKGIFSSKFEDKSPESSQRDGATKMFLQNLCACFKLEQQQEAALRIAERNYESACLSSQAAATLEAVFLSQCKSATGWEVRRIFFEGMLQSASAVEDPKPFNNLNDMKALEYLKNLAALAEQASQKHSTQLSRLESFYDDSGKENLSRAKEYLKR
jgi:hypothetical protein